SMIEAHRDAYRAEEVRMKAAFDKVAATGQATGAFTAEWRSLDSYHLASAVQLLLPAARSADLVIASQADRDWDGTVMLDFPD
ncbi:hypothetical protein ABTL47_19785, partial [Acinetobacter baumannii]